MRRLLESVRADETPLIGRVDSSARLQRARVLEVLEDRFILRTDRVELRGQPQLPFNFLSQGVRYFFAASPIAEVGPSELLLAIPEAIYEAERRDLRRRHPRPRSASARALCISMPPAPWSCQGRIVDESYQGLGLLLAESDATRLGNHFQVRIVRPQIGERVLYASVKHSRRSEGDQIFLGLRVGAPQIHALIDVEDRPTIIPESERPKWSRIRVERTPPHPESGDDHIVQYHGPRRQPISAIISQTGRTTNAPVVVIPPAWGKTKETLLGLAQTLIQTFEAARESLVVVRFDGRNRRGESYIAEQNRQEGREYLAFRFSDAVEDIRATLDYFEAHTQYQADQFYLVTYSLGAIEGRRAVALDRRIRGWVSVAGMPDLQSGLRAVSGGIDYAYGALSGVRFGVQELVGVAADMDRTGRDAIDHGLVFEEDARLDMEKIDVPITWIHGREDGWIQLDRVRALMSSGPRARRKLVQIPSGHRIRTSREAYDTFQLVAQEISEMSLGRRLSLSRLDYQRVAAAGQREMDRLPVGTEDFRAFWDRYLLGGADALGIDLLASTAAYQSFMRSQVELLRVSPGDVVLDLGCGVGTFPVAAERAGAQMEDATILELDFVMRALKGLPTRFSQLRCSHQVHRLCADVSLQLPVASASVDCVIASLLLSYVRDPLELLKEIARVLRPGGRLVVSSMRRDADISKLYVDGAAELLPDRIRAHLGSEASVEFQRKQQRFLAEAAKILDLEERGRFRFFDLSELADLATRAGFVDAELVEGFGHPPQAGIVAARRT